MGDYASLVAEEITATLDRAGFEGLSSESFRIEVTDSFQRKLGACRPARRPDESADTARYEIRIARRLFEDDIDRPPEESTPATSREQAPSAQPTNSDRTSK